MPPPGTADSGSDDPASESSEVAATSEPKSYLVMSGGEGYIDFRLGTRSSSATILNPSSLTWFCMYRSPSGEKHQRNLVSVNPSAVITTVFIHRRRKRWIGRVHGQPAVNAHQGRAEPPHCLAGHDLTRLINKTKIRLKSTSSCVSARTTFHFLHVSKFLIWYHWFFFRPEVVDYFVKRKKTYF